MNLHTEEDAGSPDYSGNIERLLIDFFDYSGTISDRLSFVISDSVVVCSSTVSVLNTWHWNRQC